MADYYHHHQRSRSHFNNSTSSSALLVEDYSEIFGRGSGEGIPILDLPVVDLSDEAFNVDVRREGFDYSEIFGGFGEFDCGVEEEEMMLLRCIGGKEKGGKGRKERKKAANEESVVRNDRKKAVDANEEGVARNERKKALNEEGVVRNERKTVVNGNEESVVRNEKKMAVNKNEDVIVRNERKMAVNEDATKNEKMTPNKDVLNRTPAKSMTPERSSENPACSEEDVVLLCPDSSQSCNGLHQFIVSCHKTNQINIKSRKTGATGIAHPDVVSAFASVVDENIFLSKTEVDGPPSLSDHSIDLNFSGEIRENHFSRKDITKSGLEDFRTLIGNGTYSKEEHITMSGMKKEKTIEKSMSGRDLKPHRVHTGIEANLKEMPGELNMPEIKLNMSLIENEADVPPSPKYHNLIVNCSGEINEQILSKNDITGNEFGTLRTPTCNGTYFDEELIKLSEMKEEKNVEKSSFALQRIPSGSEANVIQMPGKLNLSEINLETEKMHVRKSMSGSDLQSLLTGNEAYLKEKFITLSDVNLKTNPSSLPPPSRQPPKVAVRREDSRRFTTSISSNSIQGCQSDGSPALDDVEVDPMAAIKEAMEKAQAAIKSAKEERNMDGPQYRKRAGLKSEATFEAAKLKEQKSREAFEDGGATGGFAKLEKPKSSKVTLLGADGEGRARIPDLNADNVDLKSAIEPRSTEESHRERSGEWKADAQYFELVGIDKLRKASETTEKKLMPAVEAYQYRQQVSHEVNEKKLKEDNEKAELGKMQIEAQEQEVQEQKEKQQRLKKARDFEIEQTQLKEAREKILQNTREKEEKEMRLRLAREKEEHEMRLKDILEQEERETKLREERERVEYEKRLNAAREQEQKKLREQEEQERILKEVREREEHEKILKQARELEEREIRLRLAREQEEREIRLRLAREQEETEMRWKVQEQEEKERQLKEENERVENEMRILAKHEENEKQQKIILEREVKEKKLKEACELEEYKKRIKEAIELEEIEKKKKEACKGEEAKRAKDTIEQDQRELEAIRRKHSDEKIEPLASKENKDIEVANALQETKEKQKGASEMCKMEEMQNLEQTHGSYIAQGNKILEAAQVSRAHEENTKAVKTDKQTFENVSIKELPAVHILLEQDKNEKLKDASAHPTAVEKKNFESMGTATSKASSDQNKRRLRDPTQIREETLSSRSKNTGSSAIDLDKTKNSSKCIEDGKKNTSSQLGCTFEETGQNINIIEERVQKERALERERARKSEEERRDRMAVERATQEARGRAYIDAKERADKAAAAKASEDRANVEARQRAIADAREKLDKASAEMREKLSADKAKEAKQRAERAAVERATAEARERAADKAALDARLRVERSVSDKFSSAPRNGGMRQTSSFSDVRDQQFQSSSYSNSSQRHSSSSHQDKSQGIEVESAQRCKARLERHQRTYDRAAKALDEKNMRDLQAQKEQIERNRFADTLDADVRRWSSGKEGNIRALLSTLQYILGSGSGWQPIPLTEVITAAAVKKAYRKATLCVHPDKLQQRGASLQQKYICEKVFDLLKDAWNKYNSEER